MVGGGRWGFSAGGPRQFSKRQSRKLVVSTQGVTHFKVLMGQEYER